MSSHEIDIEIADRALRVAVVGTGYVGLTTGVCLAHLGAQVVCCDVDANKVAMLSAGHVPIVEEGLEEILADAVRAGNLTFVLGCDPAVRTADVVFLCVPTPQDEDGSADLSYVRAAAAEIGVAYREIIGRHYPAMAAVQVVALIEDRAKVEIEATAVV